MPKHDNNHHHGPFNPHHGHPTHFGHHHAHPGYRRYSYVGSGTWFIAGVILIPAFIIALILSSTATYTSASMATLGAASVGTGIAFSIATFGLGALLVYGALGLGYLYSSTKECYLGQKNVIDMIHSRVINEDGLKVKGTLKAIGAVLWSPFLLLGGLTGMGVKAVIEACHQPQSDSQEEENLEESSFVMVEWSSQLDPRTKSTPPVHTPSVFSAPRTQENTQKNEDVPTTSLSSSH